MMRLSLLLAAIAAVGIAITVACAVAQQPDPAVLQRVIPSLQQQRNEAMDKAALAEARTAQLAEEVQRLKAELEKTKEKPKEKPKETPRE